MRVLVIINVALGVSKYNSVCLVSVVVVLCVVNVALGVAAVVFLWLLL